MAGLTVFLTVFVSVIPRRNWEARVSVFASREALVEDLREYHNEMMDGDDDTLLADNAGEKEIVAAIFEDLNEEVIIEETGLVTEDAG